MIEERAAKVRLLILDVDGVLTDGRIVINDDGEEIKAFHVRDGQGLKLLLRGGVDVVIVSGRKSKAVEHRAKELGIREVHLGVKDKESLCRKMIRQKKLKREQVCSVGDDLPDLAKFKHSGLSVAVADAVPEVRKAASFTTKNLGGNGAVREVCELILKAQRTWPDIISAIQREEK